MNRIAQHHLTSSLLGLLFVCSMIGLFTQSSTAAEQKIANYSRFETLLQSSTAYADPVREAVLSVEFTSPSGKKLKVPGFWDGGRTWRVRFAPTEVGQWRFVSTCSDAKNTGLHNSKGSFTSTTPSGNTALAKHGPLTISRSDRNMIHADGTRFFWMSDVAWAGPLRSSNEEWDKYLQTRQSQKFTAVQWVATQCQAMPDGDRKQQTAYTGLDKIKIQPAFFQRLDKKVEAMNRMGLVSVPVLLWADENGANAKLNPGVSLPESEAILLARYMVARWGGNTTAWILAAQGDYSGEKADKWKRIGRAVFGDIDHAPVTILPASQKWAWEAFIEEEWLDFVGYQTGSSDTDIAIRWNASGPQTEYWARLPHRPFINLGAASEGYPAFPSLTPVSADAIRRAAYWSVLGSPAAGVSYGTAGVWAWSDGTKAPIGHEQAGKPEPWSKAVDLPGGQQMKHLVEFFSSIDWQQLRPAPFVVVNNPGEQLPAMYIAGARSDDKSVMVVYVPKDRTVEIQLEEMPPSPSVSWVNPRTGERSPGVAVVSATTCQFPTPAEGDWILFMKTDKKDSATTDGADGK
jgi:hypothetical protein